MKIPDPSYDGRVGVTGEFAAIAAIQAALPGPPDASEVWIGDDTAVLPPPAGDHFLFATDTVVAGVHADLALTGLDDLGWKALTAAVSDVAAMGGEAGVAVVSVAGPPGTDLARLYEGLGAAAAAWQCPIVGGDLTNAGDLVVTVAVTGSCAGQPVLRGGARAGDIIWLSRPVGAAAAGLRRYRALAAGEAEVEEDAALLRAHARPTAELAAGQAARRAGAHAMIDVSDGLAADLGHIAAASRVGMRLDRVPVASGASREEALGGGEDFALAFCVPESAGLAEAFSGLPAPIRIGVCTDDAGALIVDGKPLEGPQRGWEHRW
jgi:thiamine-monophosphate kinase